MCDEVCDFYVKSFNFKELHSFWGITDYDEDHIDVLLERETRRMNFHYQSRQISFRPTVVSWMKKIAALKKFDNRSIHLAVYLLDVFMDDYNISIDRLHLIALVCLLLATKFEERDSNVLKLTEANDFVENKYQKSDYFAMEVMILKHLKWNLMVPTSVHFVNIFIEFLFTEEEKNSPSATELWLDARNIVQFQLDYVMTDLAILIVLFQHCTVNARTEYVKKWVQTNERRMLTAKDVQYDDYY